MPHFPLDHLPNELLYLIISYLDAQSVRALHKLSRTLYGVCIKRLYDSTAACAPGHLTETSLILLARTLHEQPAFAEHLQQIKIGSWKAIRYDGLVARPWFSYALAAVLAMAPNVQELGLLPHPCVPPAFLSHLNKSIFQRHALRRLQIGPGIRCGKNIAAQGWWDWFFTILPELRVEVLELHQFQYYVSFLAGQHGLSRARINTVRSSLRLGHTGFNWAALEGKLPIKDLRLYCSSLEHRGLIGFIKACASLEKFWLTCNRTIDTHRKLTLNLNADDLLATLSRHRHTLRELVIDLHGSHPCASPHTNFEINRNTIPMLPRFEALTHLILPECFLDRLLEVWAQAVSYLRPDKRKPLFEAIFPPNIEYVQLRDCKEPRRTVFAGLIDVTADYINTYPKIHKGPSQGRKVKFSLCFSRRDAELFDLTATPEYSMVDVSDCSMESVCVRFNWLFSATHPTCICTQQVISWDLKLSSGHNAKVLYAMRDVFRRDGVEFEVLWDAAEPCLEGMENTCGHSVNGGFWDFNFD